MVKCVLVSYGSRKIPLFLQCNSPEDEYNELRNKFLLFMNQDDHLKKKVDLMPIFTFYHHEFRANVELYSGVAIPSGTELFLSFREPFDSPTKSTASANSFVDLAGFPASGVTAFSNDMSSVPIIIDDSLIVQEVNGEMKVILDHTSTESISTREETSESAIETIEKQTPVSSRVNSSLGNRSKSGPTKRNSTTRIKFPMDMPKWSPQTQAFIDEKKLKANVKHLVRELAFYLKTIVPFPSPSEYNIISMSACYHIPELKELAGVLVSPYSEHVALSKLLSAKMRNERQKEKERKKSTSPRSGPAENSVAEGSPSGQQTVNGVPIVELIKKLEKPSKDTKTTKELLQQTHDYRRRIIKVADTASEIWNQWKVLMDAEMIVFEHRLLHPSHFLDVDRAFQCLKSKLLALFYGDDDDDDLADVAILNVLCDLESALHPRVPKGTKKAITIVSVGSPAPIKEEYLAPCLWVAVHGEDTTQAVIFAEKQKLCEIDDLTPQNLVLSLISVYYCFHRNYPEVSKQFYEFLDFALFGIDKYAGNITYSKFKARYLDV